MARDQVHALGLRSSEFCNDMIEAPTMALALSASTVKAGFSIAASVRFDSAATDEELARRPSPLMS